MCGWARFGKSVQSRLPAVHSGEVVDFGTAPGRHGLPPDGPRLLVLKLKFPTAVEAQSDRFLLQPAEIG